MLLTLITFSIKLYRKSNKALKIQHITFLEDCHYHCIDSGKGHDGLCR